MLITAIKTFESPAEALEYVSASPIDLAFLDVTMPIMNGIELAKKLREIRSDILIVFISAYDEYIRQSNQIGGDFLERALGTKQIHTKIFPAVL